MLKSVLRYVCDNIGSPLSSKKIADTLTSEGRKVDVKTVERYLDALIESYIIYPAQRYNVKGKQYLKTLGKYYVVDIGMRFMLLGKRNTDAGHILENVIYLELLRRGYDVYVGKVDSFEVDFVAMNGNSTSITKWHFPFVMRIPCSGSCDPYCPSATTILNIFLRWMMIRRNSMTAFAASMRGIGCWVLQINAL